MSYLLDSDVFIQAKNLHYGLDFCNTIWAPNIVVPQIKYEIY